MVSRHNGRNMRPLPWDFDDDGEWSGMSRGQKEAKYANTSDLILALLGDKSPAEFLEHYGLAGRLDETQLRLLCYGEARLGKRLAGHLAVSVALDPSMQDIAKWIIVKNVFYNAAKQNTLPEVDISEADYDALRQAAIATYTDYGAQLKLLRGYSLLGPKELAGKVGVNRNTIMRYEANIFAPENFIFHRMMDVLGVYEAIRPQVMYAVFPKAMEQLSSPNPKIRAKGRKVLMGGGSLFGALLYNLRSEKGWSVELLAQKLNIIYNTIAQNYEMGEVTPDNHMVHRLADALEVNNTTRSLMFSLAFPKAVEQLSSPDAKIRAKSKQALLGGGSLLGAVLYHLRKDKG